MDTPIGGLLLIQVLLIAVNAFFAAAEIAVISLSETKLRHQAENGDRRAARMLKMVLEPSGFLSTIQIAITLAGFLGSAFAADNFAGPLVTLLHDTWGLTALSVGTLNTLCVVFITLILSYFTLVFGELVPKRVAMKKPDKVANLVCGVILTLSSVLRPVVWLLSKSVNGILRLFGIDPADNEENVTEDEIRMMVDMGEEKGAIEENERDMIENVFEFNNMTAADCMTHRTDVTALQVEDSADEILKTIQESGLSRFPVYGDDLDDVLGTVTTRDYLLSRSTGGQKSLRELLRPAYFVPESVRTDVLFRDMQAKKLHLAIVVDEYGGTSGLITMEDLLEEIVGNIYDEFDPSAKTDIEALGPNEWRVSGAIDLDTLSQTLDVPLPESEDYDTLGGLVFSQFSAIPQDGATPDVTLPCTQDGNEPQDGAPAAAHLRVQVEEIADHRVVWAHITLLPAADMP